MSTFVVDPIMSAARLDHRQGVGAAGRSPRSCRRRCRPPHVGRDTPSGVDARRRRRARCSRCCRSRCRLDGRDSHAAPARPRGRARSRTRVGLTSSSAWPAPCGSHPATRRLRAAPRAGRQSPGRRALAACTRPACSSADSADAAALERPAARARARPTCDDAEWARLLRECARPHGRRRPVRLLRSRERSMPMTFGTRRPAILIPAIADTWTDDRRRAVLLHELAHVARYDCLTQTLAFAACAVYWFHPGAWWVARRLRVERELACDDRVIAAGTAAARLCRASARDRVLVRRPSGRRLWPSAWRVRASSKAACSRRSTARATARVPALRARVAAAARGGRAAAAARRRTATTVVAAAPDADRTAATAPRPHDAVPAAD